MALSVAQLIGLWGAPVAADGSAGGSGSGLLPEDSLARVATDSRSDLRGALFVPLVGERFDGHAFLEAALLEGGAAAAVAQRDRVAARRAEELARRSGRPLWLVEDSLDAYQQLGRLRRQSLAAPVVAVTGSAGKTTTRELIRAALAPLGPVVASSGNENNDVGVPLTLLRSGTDTAALVVEMGMRGLGEIARLSRCAEPDVAVITNIGTAHIGRLGSREAIAQAKCEITDALRPGGLVVIPAGDPLLEAHLGAVWSGRVQRVALADEVAGFDPGLPAAGRIGRIEPGGERLTLLREDGLPHLALAGPVRLPLEGRHNARNLLLALAVAEELGVPLADLGSLVVDLPGGRSRRHRIGGVQVLDETYNASPAAVLAALELLAGQSGGGRRYAVLGTMLELGERSLELHHRVGRRAAELGLDGLVIVDAGEEGRAVEEGAADLARRVRVPSPEAALAPLREWLASGDHLLLKASRGVALERLLPLLEEGLADGC
ncbi:MAG: UDP-N-acetylmuramoyl-tripeptide--D-alanyl-D-alanine ligase [Synechococcaceae cyanobacterium]|nr:UDP-N-acetylmuramoyl-tripeptide--D-alanyl-D-alanine ligase [Synechococcaceae cyanobacterium]